MKKLTVLFSFLALFLVLGFTSATATVDNMKIHEIYMASRDGVQDYTLANKLVRQLIAEDPKEGEYHWIAANVYLKQDMIAESQAELDMAQKLAPGLPFVANRHFLNTMETTLYKAEADKTAAAHTRFVVFCGAIGCLFIGFIFFLLIQRKRTKQQIKDRFYPGNGKSFGVVPPGPTAPYPNDFSNRTRRSTTSYPDPRSYSSGTTVINNGIDPLSAVILAGAMSQNNQPTIINNDQSIIEESSPQRAPIVDDPDFGVNTQSSDSTPDTQQDTAPDQDFGVDTSQDNTGDCASSTDFGTSDSNS